MRLLKFVLVMLVPATFALGCDEGAIGQSLDGSETSDVNAPNTDIDTGPIPDPGPPKPTGLCIDVAEVFNVGGVVLGESGTRKLPVWNCGTEVLELTSIALVDDGSNVSSSEFSLGSSTPVSVAAGDFVTIEVSFTPDALSPLGADGTRIPGVAYLQLETNLDDPIRVVMVSGFGVDEACASPVIGATLATVEPGTTVELLGVGSFAPGAVAEYEWTVEDSPTGNQGVFLPSSASPSARFELTTVGVYRFSLEVVGEDGAVSCAPAVRTIEVAYANAIEVELTWETPGDSNPDDSGPLAAADLDLHFAHPLAVTASGAPWFNSVYDCFWFNAMPNWGDFDPTANDDPQFQSDTSTGRFERVVLPRPEAGAYRIGVHAWDDNGFGASKATVKVFVRGAKVYEGSARLEKSDMWDVGSVDFAIGTFTAMTTADGSADVKLIDNPINPN